MSSIVVNVLKKARNQSPMIKHLGEKQNRKQKEEGTETRGLLYKLADWENSHSKQRLISQMVLLRLASSLLLFQGILGCNSLLGPCITLYNHCPITIFPGIKTQSYSFPPNYDGWKLFAGNNMEIPINGSWTDISVWARTGCYNDNYQCATGTCGTTMACTTEPSSPVTKANIHIDYSLLSKKATYEISLLSGFNLDMRMQATRITKGKKRSVENNLLGLDLSCPTINGCNSDLLSLCPTSLKKFNDGLVAGCFHPCETTGDPAYCCTSPYDSQATCSAVRNPGDLLTPLQLICPEYQAYKYDQKAKTCNFLLLLPSFEIHFC